MNQEFNKIIEIMQTKFQNKTIVVAVSTGVDSMVLLNLLEKLKDVKIVVAHVNHHQRLQSNEEQIYIKDYCENKNILCFVKELNFETHQNFQSEARKLRYEFFKEVLDKTDASYLLTAHHANDDLETILMRLIKSTSYKGYAGIEQETSFNNKLIYRPLLSIPKEDIYEYAKENNIKYYEDSSNQENDYFRNRIRHNIIPELLKENPSLYKEIEIFKEHINETSKILFEQIDSFISEFVKDYNGIKSIDEKAFNNLSNYMQEQVLFEVLKQYHLSKNLIEELLQQIRSDKASIVNNLNDDLTFIKEYGCLRFGKIEKREEIYLKIDHDQTILLNNGQEIIVDKNKCYFKTLNHVVWYNINETPIIIRNRLPGDKILINGKLRKLSDYLTNKKISHFVRSELIVITNELNQVLFVLGIK